MTRSTEEYRRTGQQSATRVCHATLMKVIAFEGRDSMNFRQLTPAWLKGFENFLKRKLADNSVSTYLRMLQAVYNKAVQEGVAAFIPYLFKKVYKGRMPSRSRALTEKEFQAVAHSADEPPKPLIRTRDLFLLLFYLRGMPFVDLVHLRHGNLQGNRLVYRRRKTGKLITVQIVPQAMSIIERYRTTDADAPYLFPFLTLTDGNEYTQYERALHYFNLQLKQLGTLLGLHIPLTSYCARHSWASFANFCNPDKKLISEGMGHSSIQVTEIYFQTHEIEKIEKLNLEVIAYALSEKKRTRKTA